MRKTRACKAGAGALVSKMVLRICWRFSLKYVVVELVAGEGKTGVGIGAREIARVGVEVPLTSMGETSASLSLSVGEKFC